jgi:hypothetical protein
VTFYDYGPLRQRTADAQYQQQNVQGINNKPSTINKHISNKAAMETTNSKLIGSKQRRRSMRRKIIGNNMPRKTEQTIL